MVNRRLRAHPIQFFRYLRPYLFVLVFPTLRRTVQFLLTGSYDYFLPAEVVLTVAVICFAAFKTRNFSVSGSEGVLIFRTGKILTKQTVLKVSHIVQANLNITPVDLVFRTATVKLKTGVGLRPRPEIILTLKRNDAVLLAQFLGIK